MRLSCCDSDPETQFLSAIAALNSISVQDDTERANVQLPWLDEEAADFHPARASAEVFDCQRVEGSFTSAYTPADSFSSGSTLMGAPHVRPVLSYRNKRASAPLSLFASSRVDSRTT